MMKAVKRYIELGWYLLPINYKEKIPRIKDWTNQATNDIKKAREWFENKKSNIGVLTGKKSGFWVLDVDGEEGMETLRRLEKEYGELPETITQITGSGGYHFLFEYDERVNTGTARFLPGLDIRTDGQQIVVYPSVHPSGSKYEWEVNEAERIAKSPEWLIELITKHKEQEDKPKIDIKEPIVKGERNDKLFRLACKYLDQGVTGQALYGLIKGFNAENCNPPLKDQEIERIVLSAEKYNPSKYLDIETQDIDTLLNRPKERANECFIQSLTREGILGYELTPEFKELRNKLDGIQSGMYLVGAIANVGKTTWLLNLAKSLIRKNEDLKVLFFSIDDHFKKIYFRLVAEEAKMEINKVANIGQKIKNNSALDIDKRTEMVERVEKSKEKVDELLDSLILLDETDGNSLDFIKNTVEHTSIRNEQMVVIVDNFHKIRTPNINSDAKTRFTYLSEEMKALCNRFEMPLLMTVELRKLNHDGAPTPDDLKDTVDLHYDSDVTFMLHSETERKEDSDRTYIIDGTEYPIVDIHVQKNKVSDFKGKIEYVFIPQKASFCELEDLKNTPEAPF